MQKKLYESTNGIFGDGPAMLKGIQDTAREANIKRNAGLNSGGEDALLARQLNAYQQSGTDHLGYVDYGNYQIIPMDGEIHIMGKDADTSFSDAEKAVSHLRDLLNQSDSISSKAEQKNIFQTVNDAINPQHKNLINWFFDPINGLINSPFTMTKEASEAMRQAGREGKNFGEQLLEMLKAYPRGFVKSINGDYAELGDLIFSAPWLDELTKEWEESGPIGNVTHDTVLELINFFGPDLLGKLTKAEKISDLSPKNEVYEAYKEIFDFINDANGISGTAKDAATDIEDQHNPQQ